MKKVLLSLAVIALSVAAATGATIAYFSSVRILGSNTITAGTVSFNVYDGQTVNPFNWDINNMAPGDTVNKSFTLKNTGTLPVDIYVKWTLANGSANWSDLYDELYITINGTRTKLSDVVGQNIKISTNLLENAATDDVFVLDMPTSATKGMSQYFDLVGNFTAIQTGAPAPTN